MSIDNALTVLLQTAEILRAQAIVRLYESEGKSEKTDHWNYQIQTISKAIEVVAKMKEQVTK